MNILFAIKTLDDAVGGAERVLTEVSASLAERGHQVSVLTYDRPGGRAYYPLHPGVERVVLGIGHTDRPTTFGETLRRMRALRSTVIARKPDVVVGFMHSMFIPLGIALIGTRLPMIGSEHIVWAHYRERPLEAWLLRLAPLFVKQITILSEPMRQDFPTALHRRMTIVPNPIRARSPVKADVAGVDRAHKTLLTVGRLSPQKDHRTLLAAFALLAKDFPGWSLRIVGEGLLRPDLEREIEALALQDRIELVGTTSDVGREYAEAQLFVMSSRYEAWPLATAEAVLQGLPVVGFADCPGVNDIVRDGTNGLLVAGEDRALALAEGLRTLMADADERRRLGEHGLSSLASFDPDRVAERWEDLLKGYARPAV